MHTTRFAGRADRNRLLVTVVLLCGSSVSTAQTDLRLPQQVPVGSDAALRYDGLDPNKFGADAATALQRRNGRWRATEFGVDIRQSEFAELLENLEDYCSNCQIVGPNPPPPPPPEDPCAEGRYTVWFAGKELGDVARVFQSTDIDFKAVNVRAPKSLLNDMRVELRRGHVEEMPVAPVTPPPPPPPPGDCD